MTATFARNRFRALLALAQSVLLAAIAHGHPETPGAPQKQPIAIVGATVHTMTGPPIEDATIIFDHGRIVAIGKDVKPPKNAKIVAGQGKSVYPGLMDASSNLGLVEINAVRATRDYAESGSFNPNVRAETAFNPDSELIPVTRANGVLFSVVTPSSGLVSGKAAVMQLDGWTWEDMTLRGSAALQVNWPSLNTPNDDSKGKAGVPESLRQLEDWITRAKTYRAARRAEPNRPRDIKLESLLPLIDGETPMMAAADELREIQSAVLFCERHDLKLIIQGGYDAEQCAPLLKKHDVPVVIAGVHRLPRNRSDHYDAPFTLAARLQKAGVRFCIAGTGRFGGSNIRNLPYHAGTAVAHGLDVHEALKAITLYPAQIFGVAKQVGSLEVGKAATLFVADGDILETPTHVTEAWVNGRDVSLNNRHKRLWNKYQQKYK